MKKMLGLTRQQSSAGWQENLLLGQNVSNSVYERPGDSCVTWKHVCPQKTSVDPVSRGNPSDHISNRVGGGRALNGRSPENVQKQLNPQKLAKN